MYSDFEGTEIITPVSVQEQNSASLADLSSKFAAVDKQELGQPGLRATRKKVIFNSKPQATIFASQQVEDDDEGGDGDESVPIRLVPYAIFSKTPSSDFINLEDFSILQELDSMPLADVRALATNSLDDIDNLIQSEMFIATNSNKKLLISLFRKAALKILYAHHQHHGASARVMHANFKYLANKLEALIRKGVPASQLLQIMYSKLKSGDKLLTITRDDLLKSKVITAVKLPEITKKVKNFFKFSN